MTIRRIYGEWRFAAHVGLWVAGIGFLTTGARSALWAQETTTRAEDFEGLGPYIEEAMEEWDVPGLAVAIVRNDSVVYARGFGSRSVEAPGGVDERTLFGIGSATKAFTAVTVGMLVDEGRVSWDDPVQEHLPELRLFDSYASHQLTVRDLLSHRTGVPREDHLWYGSDASREELLRRIRYLRPAYSFRDSYEYQNLMYLAAGELVARVSGSGWEDFVVDRIFEPLAMTRTNTSVNDLDDSNVSSPHAKIHDRITVVPWRNLDHVAPAGSINSSVLELSNWLRMYLNGGIFEGRRVVSEEVIRETMRPHALIPEGGVESLIAQDAEFVTYALGWMVQDYRGRKAVHHGGGIDGNVSMVAMLPEEDLGLVVLSNSSSSILPYALMYRIFDHHLGEPERDWSAEFHEIFEALVAGGDQEAARMEQARVANTTPRHRPERYAGRYEDPEGAYGCLSVRVEDDGLVLAYNPAFTGDLEHWHFDTFQIRWRDPVLATWRDFATFQLDHDGSVREVRVQPLTTFRRVEEDAARCPKPGR